MICLLLISIVTRKLNRYLDCIVTWMRNQTSLKMFMDIIDLQRTFIITFDSKLTLVAK